MWGLAKLNQLQTGLKDKILTDDEIQKLITIYFSGLNQTTIFNER